MIREDLRYTKDHEWVRMETGGDAVIGITDHAQKALGDITFVDLPKAGKAIRRHDSLAVVESVKAASDVFAPLSGTVAAANTALATIPETINRSPYDEGWICRLTGCLAGEAADLLTAAQYEALIAREA